MQQLTGLDAAFLAMETHAVFGHIGSVCVLDPSTSPDAVTLEKVTRLIEERLHLMPPFRRRLVTVPLGLDQPYWIEDPGFNIEYHVREIALPAPGDDKQLAEQAARLHARPLDRNRPLWELYLIHGLAGGRIALYSKVHHAAIDGVSGGDILAAILDLTPEGRPVDPPEKPWKAETEPSSVGHAGPVSRRRWRSSRSGRPGSATAWPVRCRPWPPRPAAELPVIDRFMPGGDDLVLQPSGLRAPATPFNKAISPHRRWAFCQPVARRGQGASRTRPAAPSTTS